MTDQHNDQSEKEERLNAAMAAGKWYAACSTGHSTWIGTDRATYQEAQRDATVHDTEKHGGTSTAVVLGG